MKVKLLRKLRTEAYQMYGIKNHIKMPEIDVQFVKDPKWEGVYVIGFRELSNKDDVVEFKLKAAKKKLRTLRNDYCVKRVQEIRTSMRIAKLCRL